MMIVYLASLVMRPRSLPRLPEEGFVCIWRPYLKLLNTKVAQFEIN